MLVTEEFTFVKAANKADTQGVYIKITLENKGDRQVSAGARYLLDTNLSEKTPGLGFTTNSRTIQGETLLTGSDNDRWWTDRNDKVSLTGSINTGSSDDPDSVHFANWKKLSDASWKPSYQSGRNFNFPPYSVGDTAVCYYYDVRPLSRGENRTFGFYLVLDEGAISGSARAADTELIQDLKVQGTADPREQDLASLRSLMARIDALIASGNATDDELAALEFDLNKLRAKYGSGDAPR